MSFHILYNDGTYTKDLKFVGIGRFVKKLIL